MRTSSTIVAMLLAAYAASASGADGAAPEPWSWRVAAYAWFPTARSATNIEVPGRGTVTVDVSPDRYLSDLEFAFMGTIEGRRGAWSVIGDAVYFDFDKRASASLVVPVPGGAVPASADARVALEGFVGALGVGRSVLQTPAGHVDLLAGARYLRIETRTSYDIALPTGDALARGEVARAKDFWDAVVGMRGRLTLVDRWFVPYHLDAGAGSSRFTWQAFAGIGYRFDHGELTIGYRHLAFDFERDRPLSDLALGGPLAGVSLRF